MNGDRDRTARFPTEARLHVGLEVRDLRKSVAFYRALFDAEPSKLRHGYAKFEPADPSVNLSLIESPASTAPTAPGGATHYGIQVKSADAMHGMTARLEGAGLPLRVEEETTCCYAVQDKVWVTDPDGNPWEIFRVLDEAGERADAASSCCSEACEA